MIEALVVKILFGIPAIWNIYVSEKKRPFSFLELSIIVWGCCFIAGWYVTGKRIKKLYDIEGYSLRPDGQPAQAECFEDTVKNGFMSVAWMLEVNNKFTFFFKSLYWFSYAFVHSLFLYMILAAAAYTYMIFRVNFSIDEDATKGLYGKVKYWWDSTQGTIVDDKDGKKDWSFPAVVSMAGMFIFFDSKFIFIHVLVFIVSFIAFYICCLMFLQVEEDDEYNIKQITVNRLRFKYIHYISYIFIDSCYMLIEFIMMLFFEIPTQLHEALDTWRRDKLLEFFSKLGGLKNTNGQLNSTKISDPKNFESFMTWVNTWSVFDRPIKSKIISLVRKLPNRDAFVNDINTKLGSKPA